VYPQLVSKKTEFEFIFPWEYEKSILKKRESVCTLNYFNIEKYEFIPELQLLYYLILHVPQVISIYLAINLPWIFLVIIPIRLKHYNINIIINYFLWLQSIIKTIFLLIYHYIKYWKCFAVYNYYIKFLMKMKLVGNLHIS